MRHKVLIVKMPEVLKFQWNQSSLSFKWTSIKRWTRCCHLFHLFPIKVLLKPMLNGTKAINICNTFLWRTILYKEGYYPAKYLSPSQESSQNLVVKPLPFSKSPLAKKSSLPFIKTLQKGESVGFAITWVKVLDHKYLL
jgi:hypothetical protein